MMRKLLFFSAFTSLLFCLVPIAFAAPRVPKKSSAPKIVKAKSPKPKLQCAIAIGESGDETQESESSEGGPSDAVAANEDDQGEADVEPGSEIEDDADAGIDAPKALKDSSALNPDKLEAETEEVLRDDRSPPPIIAYINRHKRYYKPLTLDEDIAAGTYDTKTNEDPKAREKLIRGALMVVVHMVMPYHRRGYRYVDDLIAAGNLGLVKAAYKYQGSRGLKFITYAGWWIWAEINLVNFMHFRMVRTLLGKKEKRLYWSLMSAIFELRAKNEPIDFDVLAARFDVDSETVRYMLHSFNTGPEISLSDTGGDEGNSPLIERIDSGSPRADDLLAVARKSAALKELLKSFGSQLNERERDIFEKRFLSDKLMTLQELSEIYDVSKERIRQLHIRIGKKLIAFLNARRQELQRMGYDNLGDVINRRI